MTQPAQNIMKTAEFKDAIFFQSACDCTNPEHGHSLIVTMDEDGFVTCELYQSLEWAQYGFYDHNVFARIWNRIVNATKYLFTGYVKAEGHHIFGKEEALRDYANALLGAADELNRRRSVSIMPEDIGPK